MTAQFSPGRIGVPPPAAWNLVDADRAVGWTTANAVGFRGFANQAEAVHAAWVAYRALTRRLARTHGTRPIPIATDALAVQRRGDREVVLASGRPIAVLLRPGVDSASGPDSFGFEIEIPQPADELRVRAMAHLMYRTVRKSGLPWALWRSRDTRDGRLSATDTAATARGSARIVTGSRPASVPSGAVIVGIVVLAAIAIVTAAILIAAAPRTVTIPLGLALVTGVVATIFVATGDAWLARRDRRRIVPVIRPPRERLLIWPTRPARLARRETS